MQVLVLHGPRYTPTFFFLLLKIQTIIQEVEGQELMSRSMQPLYKAYVTAFLQTDLPLAYLFFCESKEGQFRSSDAVTSISFL